MVATVLEVASVLGDIATLIKGAEAAKAIVENAQQAGRTHLLPEEAEAVHEALGAKPNWLTAMDEMERESGA